MFPLLSQGSASLCQNLVWSAWKPDSGSVLAQQPYSLKLKSPWKGGRSVHFLFSKTADHAQPTPNPYLFPSLTIVRFGHHPPSALGFRCRFGTLWWMNPWLLDLGPKQRVSYLVIPCESPLYGLALGCLSWIDTARLRTLFAST